MLVNPKATGAYHSSQGIVLVWAERTLDKTTATVRLVAVGANTHGQSTVRAGRRQTKEPPIAAIDAIPVTGANIDRTCRA